MNTLYIDTHCDILEIVLFKDGKVLDIERSNSEHNHSSLAMPLLVNLLNKQNMDIHDIQEIIVVNGPGSFTGIRIGITIAKTLAYTLNIPIKVMSSLLIKAVSYHEKGHHWFLEEEKNGFYIGEFNELNELLKDYFYLKRSAYEQFVETQDVIVVEKLDYEAIYEFARDLPCLNPHMVNPLYVKLIEVQK